jgi:hypothetical protein
MVREQALHSSRKALIQMGLYVGRTLCTPRYTP